MNVLSILFIINYAFCLIAVFDMIFVSKKKPERIIAWTILLIVPFVGLLLYLIIGAGISQFVKSMIKKYKISNQKYQSHIQNQIKALQYNQTDLYPSEYKDLILLNLKTSNAIFSRNNNIKYLLDGNETVENLKKDIQNAKSSIHLEFYIFANDKIGKEIINLLTKKAQQGVEVRVLYDAIGSLRTSKHSFKKLIKAKGKVSVFFPPFLNIKLMNLKANYRNHRKVCVIDGKIGYIGGFNVRDDHLGRNKKLAPWRDTTLRLTGGAVHSMQNIFLSDWRFASKDDNNIENYLNQKYFPKIDKTQGETQAQVIYSGPDSYGEAIKECIIKMMSSAKQSIKIQTPYFVPDEHFIGTIKLALLSGVEVSLMIPKKYDHWFMHYAGLNYINELLKYGLKVYVYDGFIHGKVVMIDDCLLTLGSCNIDVRSFSLNFEDNIVIYDKKSVEEYVKCFETDVANCMPYTEQTRKSLNMFAKFVISFCRLFSAIL